MVITVIPNGCSKPLKSLTGAVCDRLKRAGAEVRLLESPSGLPTASQIRQALTDAALAIAIGGDGTIIHISKVASETACPVLGINGGRLGFLAGLEENELELLDRLFSGDYAVDRRRILELTVAGSGAPVTYTALNEAVVSRGSLSHAVDLTVARDGHPILSCRADGMIVATATGSTAYSLSAGGPIVDPELECLLVTPICPHAAVYGSRLLPPSAVVTVNATAPIGESAFLTVDGEDTIPLSADDTLSIRLTDRSADLIRLKAGTFYDTVQNKLFGRGSV